MCVLTFFRKEHVRKIVHITGQTMAVQRRRFHEHRLERFGFREPTGPSPQQRFNSSGHVIGTMFHHDGWYPNVLNNQSKYLYVLIF
jgi:hypothetical protein